MKKKIIDYIRGFLSELEHRKYVKHVKKEVEKYIDMDVPVLEVLKEFNSAYTEYEEFYPTEEDFIQEEEYRAYTLLGEEIYEKGSF